MRQQLGSLVGSAGGLVVAGNLELTQKGTPNMSVQVAAGSCWIPGFPAGGTNPYFFNNSATYERTIAASGSEPRVDTVVVQIKDEAYEGTGHEPVIEVLKGVEASGTTLGNLKGIASVPHGCLVLGYVLVEKSASSIVTADIQQAAEVVGVGVGAWTAMESLGPKVEESEAATYGKLQARTEGGVSLRIRGGFKIKTGQTATNTDILLTLPTALRPKYTVVVAMTTQSVSSGTFGIIPVEVTPTGLVKILGGAFSMKEGAVAVFTFTVPLN
jgi:hypothetical protein